MNRPKPSKASAPEAAPVKALATLVLGVLFVSGCAQDGAPTNGAAAMEDARMVLLPVPEDPTVSFSISFGVGSQDDPPELEGLAYLTGQLIENGATENHSYEEILQALYPLAAGYSLRVDKETSTLTGRSHRDNLDRYLELLTDAYLRPAFTEEDFERLRSDAINYLSNELRYSSDEELAKAALYGGVFEGTPYAHPPQGSVSSLAAIELDDVRAFYTAYYTRANVTVAVGGGYDDALLERLRASIDQLPAAAAPENPAVEVAAIDGLNVVLIDKPGADASISFGFPIDVHRGERDFYALWVANSWLGEHRNQASHLFQVIREERGLNYGDYSYIESFPEGGQRTMPPVNVARRQQIFEVWIRTLPDTQALFALRAAMRELDGLIDNGLSPEEFELTRAFLKKYSLHFANTTSARLGYAVDDRFYGIGDDGHLETFRRTMDELTVEEVNTAIRRHLQTENMIVAIVTGDAEGLAATLASGSATPIDYPTPKRPEILAEDESIAAYPLTVASENIEAIPVASIFE